MSRFDNLDTENGDEESNSLPVLPSDSPGSSVSTRLEDEYDELLRHAVVIPHAIPVPSTLDIPQDNIEAEFKSDSIFQAERNTGKKAVFSATPVVKQTTSTASHVPSPRRELPPTPQPPQTDAFPRKTIPSMAPIGFDFSPFPAGTDLTDSELTPELQQAKTIEEQRTIIDYSPTTDVDIGRMEHMMDRWCSELKRSVLAELGQSKIRIIDSHRKMINTEREERAADVSKLGDQIEQMRELLHTYEISVERKDQMINNLTRAIDQQRQKQQLLRNFSLWKLEHCQEERERFTSRLAFKQYERSLMQRAWGGWHSLIENKWKQRVEKACQAKAQEVCISLTNDYESKLASLNEALDAARIEVKRLHTERDHYEETMKKAFMRGVCALNMEAMTMFHASEDGETNDVQRTSHEISTSDVYSKPQSIPYEAVYSDHCSHSNVSAAEIYSEKPQSTDDRAPPPKIVTSLAATRATGSSAGSRVTFASQPSSSASSALPKVVEKSSDRQRKITAKISASNAAAPKPTSNLLGLAPTSVVVERHQPVVKETIGRAMAAHYASKQRNVRPATKTDTLSTIALAKRPLQTVHVGD